MQLMKHVSAVITLIVIPVYVLSVFVSFVFAPAHQTVQKKTKKNILTVMFVGDMMFDRYIRDTGEINGYETIFADSLDLFKGSDVLIGNLEGPITTFLPVSRPNDTSLNHYKFTFATSVAPVLASVGFDAMLLANNHIQNFGKEGYTQTKDILAKHGIGYFGYPDNPYEPWRYASGTQHVVLYAYDIWYTRNVETITKKIMDESDDYFVIVYAHWGDEYEIVPNPEQIHTAHAFIDAGADLIVGSHPHVVQSKEVYKGKWIYYSLGNFVFDQYFSDTVKCGLALSIKINEDKTYTTTEKFAELHRDGTTKTSECMAEVPFLDE